MTENMKQKTQEAKGKAYDTAQSAKDRTAETKNQSGSFLSEKTGAVKEKALETTQVAKEKASETIGAAKEKAAIAAQATKEKTSGVPQKTTGEQVMGMAQGAIEAVKQTFGMKTDETTSTGEEENPNKKPAEAAGKEKTSGVPQKTAGGQVMSMAQGATVAVKQTFGMKTASTGEEEDPNKKLAEAAGKEKTSGIPQKTTGEQVMSMAQGATVAVKKTLGMKTTTGEEEDPNKNTTTTPRESKDY